MITLKQLQSVCSTEKGRDLCAQYVDGLNQYMPLYGIDTAKRIAAFIAQIAHESGDFTRVTENLNYSAQGLANTWKTRYSLPNGKPNELALKIQRNPEAIANHTYSGRYGNGDIASGDGWRYRGRGLKQLTFKDNYARCAADTGLPLVKQPELLELPDGAAISACWFWEKNGLNRFADSGDFRGLTRAINGGYNGLDDRTAYLSKCQRVFV